MENKTVALGNNWIQKNPITLNTEREESKMEANQQAIQAKPPQQRRQRKSMSIDTSIELNTQDFLMNVQKAAHNFKEVQNKKPLIKLRKMLKTNTIRRIKEDTKSSYSQSRAKSKSIQDKDEVKEIKIKNEYSGKFQKCIRNLTIIFFIKRFIKVIQSQSTLFRFHQLQRKQFYIINDQSAVYEYFRFNNQFYKDIPGVFQRLQRQIIQCFQSFLIKLGYDKMEYEDQVTQIVPLNPTSSLKIFFDFIQMFVLMYMTLFIPIQISFGLQDNLSIYLSIIWLMIDIFLIKTNTAIYIDGILICDRYSVIGSYLKGNFLIDIVTTFSMILCHTLKIPFFGLIFLIRVFDITKIYGILEVTLQFSDTSAALSRLFQLTGTFFFLAHYVACTWHLLGMYEIANPDPTNSHVWITSSLDFAWNVQYINSLYWAIITMTTIGYGDVVANSYREKVFCILVAVISTIIVSFLMNNIGGILHDLQASQARFKLKMLNLNSYMTKRQLNSELRMKVLNYFQYLNNERSGADEQGSALVNEELSPSLRDEVLKDIYGQIIRSKKFFNLFFSSKLIDELALKMKEITMGPEEIIYKEGEQGNKMYFILKGSVEIFLNIEQYNSPHIKLSNISDGDTFGEYEFFNNISREQTARSIGVTNLAYIDMEDFDKLMKHFPNDNEQIKVIRHQFYNCGIKTGLELQCKCCGGYDHNVMNCPLVYMIPNVETIILRKQNIQNKQQDRNLMVKKRKLFKSSDAVKKNLRIINNAKRLMHIIENEVEIQKRKSQLKAHQNDSESDSDISSIQEANSQSEDEDSEDEYHSKKKKLSSSYCKKNLYEKQSQQSEQSDPKNIQKKAKKSISQKQSQESKSQSGKQSQSGESDNSKKKQKKTIFDKQQTPKEKQLPLIDLQVQGTENIDYKLNLENTQGKNDRQKDEKTNKKKQDEKESNHSEQKEISLIEKTVELIPPDDESLYLEQNNIENHNYEFKVKTIEFDILNNFDSFKLFDYFFPHNNYDVILTEVERNRINSVTFKDIINNQKKKLQKQVKRFRQFLEM